jgi:D-amino-acid oxidase
MKILVLGCGVSGLSSAILLQEAGHDVAIWARELPPRTTSNLAAAVWYPYKAYPRERVLAWSGRSFSVFHDMAGRADTGVTMVEALELLHEPAPDPWWRGCVHEFRHARAGELRPGYLDGWVFEVPRIEMPLYMDYLVRRFRDQGGSIEQRNVRALDEALDACPVVVNCTGLGARELARDPALYPIRGQIVRVSKPKLERVLLHEGERSTYVIPRSTDCILGGTAEENDDSLVPDKATAEDIRTRCALLAPETREMQVLEHLVGSRPGRPAVRLEAERPSAATRLIHDYGHGGAGVTLSWGCAEEVVQLVLGHAPDRGRPD